MKTMNVFKNVVRSIDLRGVESGNLRDLSSQETHLLTFFRRHQTVLILSAYFIFWLNEILEALKSDINRYISCISSLLQIANSVRIWLEV